VEEVHVQASPVGKLTELLLRGEFSYHAEYRGLLGTSFLEVWELIG